MIGPINPGSGIAIMISEEGDCMEMFITGHGKMHGKSFSDNPHRLSHLSLVILDGKIVVREGRFEEKEKA